MLRPFLGNWSLFLATRTRPADAFRPVKGRLPRLEILDRRKPSQCAATVFRMIAQDRGENVCRIIFAPQQRAQRHSGCAASRRGLGRMSCALLALVGGTPMFAAGAIAGTPQLRRQSGDLRCHSIGIIRKAQDRQWQALKIKKMLGINSPTGNLADATSYQLSFA